MHEPQSVSAYDSQTPVGRVFLGVERVLGLAVETAGGLLVLAETIILFAGVYSRYVLHRPFVWSDELASILFLWLAMLGAVIGMLASLAVMLTLSLAMTELLRRIVVSLAHGDPFVPQNAQRLRDMGWLSILIQIVTLVGGAMAMAIEDAAGEVTTDYDLSLGGLLLPLVLFVLARVFQEGSRLRDDLEGTV